MIAVVVMRGRCRHNKESHYFDCNLVVYTSLFNFFKSHLANVTYMYTMR